MTTTLSPETISLTVHQNTPVITTELLAQLYGTETNNIKVNFTRNADRFVCGKHYFKLEGNELREFKHKVTQSNLVASRAKHLILWTERGAARHAKMLETDQAWEVFEKLEDFYFSQKNHEKLSAPKNPENSPASFIPQRFLLTLVQGRWSSEPVPQGAFVATPSTLADRISAEAFQYTADDMKKIIQACLGIV